MIKLTLRLSVVALVAIGCGGDDDGSEETTFEVDVTKADEVPVCAAAGASAAGEATVTINAESSEVEVELTWNGLSAAATAAHIHTGADGVAGGVIFSLGTNPTSPVTETFTATDYPAPVPAGAPADFAAFVTAMKAGNSYINIHTAACGAGEIRGQISN